MIKTLTLDYPEQFKGKPNIEAIASAFDNAISEVLLELVRLRDNRLLSNAVGFQLDRIGDIVCLSRESAASELGLKTIDDEEYRVHLFKQILKNTSDCTYYDVMESVGLLWDGPPLRYSENPTLPATIIFDFDEDARLDENSYKLPIIKPSGTSIKFNMNRTDDCLLGIGLAEMYSESMEVDCDEPVLVPQTYLTDEDEIILTDERGNWLSE